MTTIARPRVQPSAESWELPNETPFLVRVARPWLRNPAGLLGLIIVLPFLFLGVLGSIDWITGKLGNEVGALSAVAPYDPSDFDSAARYAAPSAEHPFGTTKFGEDILSRVIFGAWVSFWFGAAVLLVGFIPGTTLGIVSGYSGRWVDYTIQRSGEAWSAIPQLPLLLTVIAAVGPGLTSVVIVLAISAIFGGSRLMRGIAMLEKNKDYVFAARSLGGSEFHVLWRHLLPNIMPYILVGASSVFAIAVLAEATLSFLGLGLQAGTPGWGIDLAAGRAQGASNYPHLVIFPGLAISLTVFGFTLLGDTLRDILDPRLRGSTGPRK